MPYYGSFLLLAGIMLFDSFHQIMPFLNIFLRDIRGRGSGHGRQARTNASQEASVGQETSRMTQSNQSNKFIRCPEQPLELENNRDDKEAKIAGYIQSSLQTAKSSSLE